MKSLKLGIFILGIALGTLMFSAISGIAAAETYRSYTQINDLNQGEETSTTQNDAQSKISDIFSNLETAGNSYNSGGGASAALAMVDAGCRAALDRAMNTKLFSELQGNFAENTAPFMAKAGRFVNGRVGNMGQMGLSQLCAALKGDEISSPDIAQMLKKGVRSDLTQQALSFGQMTANASGLPFLSRLEIETGTSERSLIGSITSVQPLWEDKLNLHHVFAQLSWYKAPENSTSDGKRNQFDTYNAGVAYRYLTPDKKYLYGTNMFFDYAPHNNHSRMSIGVDARSSQLAFSANRYMPLSTWRAVDLYNEERAAAGWDVELRGQVPELPSWTGIVKGYQWDGFAEGTKLYGGQAAVEYSPFPAMAMRVGVRDESEGSASLEAALRFNWRFDQPQDLQFKPRTELASVEDYVYEKVHRENIIRVKQRQKASAKLTVVETVGANTAQEPSGASSLHLGQSLKMPVTVTTANTVGAIARLELSDGSLLTLAQNSSATVDVTLITLVSGSMQYVSNGLIQTIAVPGGTVALHGTDIDVVASGATSSSVRVRDGSVTFTGGASGATDLMPEELAAAVNGVVGGALPTSDPVFISHTDLVSEEIDRVADPQVGPKVAPYPYEAPRIVTQTLIPGHQIIIGLKFNTAVIVSGGTPRLNLSILGVSRTANYISGSGTDDLRFAYTVVPGDAGASDIDVTSFSKNGATIMGDGKDAVTTIADSVLSLVGVIGDTTAPSGYALTFTTAPINNTNKSAASVRVTGAEVGSHYDLQITSSGGGTAVTRSGTITSATQNFTGLNLTGLADGTLTAEIVLTDISLNVGSPVTVSTTKDIVIPTGYAIAYGALPINSSNANAVTLSVTGAEVGTTYSYTVTSSGGGTPVTGTATVSATSFSITGVDLSGLSDGTFTATMTITDTNGNAGSPVMVTTSVDTSAPTGYSVSYSTPAINDANKSSVDMTISSAEVGATYAYSISSSGGGAPVTGTGTISSATQNITGLDLSSLGDGTLTVSVTLTDTAGNAGGAVTSTAGKDILSPTGYATNFVTSPVNNSNKASVTARITGAEVGTTYAYSITSSGGGAPVTGTGTVASATQNITGLDLSSLGDGTLTVSVTLTDTAGNAGAATTGTVLKEVSIPTGYAAAFTTSPINDSNKAAGAFDITGAEVGATYAYSISSSGGGTAVTGSGTVASATQSVTAVDLSGLGDGTLTVSVTLTDAHGNAGSAVTGTVAKDATLPSGYAAAFTTTPVNLSNYTAAAFDITGAEVGATYNYTITSSGGGTTVTGTGTVASATQSVTGLDLTGLSDGTLTLVVSLSDTSGNAGSPVSDSATDKDVVAPTITSVTTVDGTYEP